jgi:hypothetical protein
MTWGPERITLLDQSGVESLTTALVQDAGFSVEQLAELSGEALVRV